LARAKWKDSLATPAELATAMVHAAHGIYQALFQEYEAGRGTLDSLLKASIRVLHSERALHGKEVDQGLSRERAWIRSRVISDVNKARYEAGRMSFKDWAEARYFCLQAEIALAEVSGPKEKPQALLREWHRPLRSADLDLYGKELAHALFEAVHADPKELAK